MGDPGTKISGTLIRTEKVSVGESCSITIRICGICMDVKAEEEMFKSSCSHPFCRECIGSHVAANISENIVEVKCPDLECTVLFEPDDCRSVITPLVLERWKIGILESRLGPNKLYCPFGDCSGLMALDSRAQECLTSAECPYCHRLFCARCRVPWHAGSRCKPVGLDAMFVMLAREKRWQQCPNCQIHVERIEGCAGIRCRCGYKFCYLCGSVWTNMHVCKGTAITIIIGLVFIYGLPLLAFALIAIHLKFSYKFK